MKKHLLRFLTVMLMACLSVGVLAACGDNGPNEQQKPDDPGIVAPVSEYTAVFRSADGTTNLPTDSKKYKAGDTVTIPAGAPVREGYTFLGWALNSDAQSLYQPGGSYTVKAEDAAFGEIAFYAVWEAGDPAKKVKYTVQYVAMNGDAVDEAVTLLPADPVIYRAGDVINISAQIPAKEGYAFKGWTLNNDASKLYQYGSANATYAITGSEGSGDEVVLKFYAQWDMTVDGIWTGATRQGVDNITLTVKTGFDGNGWFVLSAAQGDDAEYAAGAIEKTENGYEGLMGGEADCSITIAGDKLTFTFETVGEPVTLTFTARTLLGEEELGIGGTYYPEEEDIPYIFDFSMHTVYTNKDIAEEYVDIIVPGTKFVNVGSYIVVFVPQEEETQTAVYVVFAQEDEYYISADASIVKLTTTRPGYTAEPVDKTAIKHWWTEGTLSKALYDGSTLTVEVSVSGLVEVWDGLLLDVNANGDWYRLRMDPYVFTDSGKNTLDNAADPIFGYWEADSANYNGDAYKALGSAIIVAKATLNNSFLTYTVTAYAADDVAHAAPVSSVTHKLLISGSVSNITLSFYYDGNDTQVESANVSYTEGPLKTTTIDGVWKNAAEGVEVTFVPSEDETSAEAIVRTEEGIEYFELSKGENGEYTYKKYSTSYTFALENNLFVMTKTVPNPMGVGDPVTTTTTFADKKDIPAAIKLSGTYSIPVTWATGTIDFDEGTMVVRKSNMTFTTKSVGGYLILMAVDVELESESIFIIYREAGSYYICDRSDFIEPVKLSKQTLAKYTVIFELGEHAAATATAPAAITETAGNQIQLPAAPAAEEGYEFIGWFEEANVELQDYPHAAGSPYTVTGNVKLVALFAAIEEEIYDGVWTNEGSKGSVTIQLSASGSTGNAIVIDSVGFATYYELTAAADGNGYTGTDAFGSSVAFVVENGTLTVDGTAYAQRTDLGAAITLTGIYTGVSSDVGNFSINFDTKKLDMGDFGSMNFTTVQVGSYLVVHTDMADIVIYKNADKYYALGLGAEPVELSVSVPAETTYTLKFYNEKDNYEGQPFATQTVTLGDGDAIGEDGIPTGEPTKQYYEFAGWYYDDQTEVDEAFVPQGKDTDGVINVYAKWTQVESLPSATQTASPDAPIVIGKEDNSTYQPNPDGNGEGNERAGVQWTGKIQKGYHYTYSGSQTSTAGDNAFSIVTFIWSGLVRHGFFRIDRWIADDNWQDGMGANYYGPAEGWKMSKGDSTDFGTYRAALNGTFKIDVDWTDETIIVIVMEITANGGKEAGYYQGYYSIVAADAETPLKDEYSIGFAAEKACAKITNIAKDQTACTSLLTPTISENQTNPVIGNENCQFASTNFTPAWIGNPIKQGEKVTINATLKSNGYGAYEVPIAYLMSSKTNYSNLRLDGCCLFCNDFSWEGLTYVSTPGIKNANTNYDAAQGEASGADTEFLNALKEGGVTVTITFDWSTAVNKIIITAKYEKGDMTRTTIFTITANGSRFGANQYFIGLGGENIYLQVSSITHAEAAPKTYSVTFEANAGEDDVTGMPGSATVEAGSYTIPADEPTREGYTFKGWKVKNGGDTIYKNGGTNGTYDITEDVIFVAEWEENAPAETEYTVQFWSEKKDSYTGEPDKGSKTFQLADGVGITAESQFYAEPPTKANYTFAGWWLDDETQYTEGFVPSAHAQGGTTLNVYAKWTLNATIELEEITATNWATKVYQYPENINVGDVLTLTGDMTLTRETKAEVWDGVQIALSKTNFADHATFAYDWRVNAEEGKYTEIAKGYLTCSIAGEWSGVAFPQIMNGENVQLTAVVSYPIATQVQIVYTIKATVESKEETFSITYVYYGINGDAVSVGLAGEAAKLNNGQIVRSKITAPAIEDTMAQQQVTIGTSTGSLYGTDVYKKDIKAGQTLTITGNLQAANSNLAGFGIEMVPYGASNLIADNGVFNFRIDNAATQSNGWDYTTETCTRYNYSIAKSITRVGSPNVGQEADINAQVYWTDFAAAKQNCDVTLTIAWTEADKIVITMSFSNSKIEGYTGYSATQVYTVTPISGHLADVYSLTISPDAGYIANAQAQVTYNAIG